jgi:hypothetical protein
MLSLYGLPALVRKQIDRIRCKFFWQGSSNHRKKYALVAWKKLCLPKEMGGLGILDLNTMNMAVLLKWLWELKQPQYHIIWKQLVHIKYKHNNTAQNKSPIWREIHRLNNICNLGCSVNIGNGMSTYF